MKIIFISNFLNHHQKEFCESMIQFLGEDNFRFIAVTPQAQEQKKLGYIDYNNEPYCIKRYESKRKQKEAKNWINTSDIVLIGGVSYRYVLRRLYFGKPVIRYSERILKKSNETKRIKFWLNILFYYILPIHKMKCLLTAGAYAVSDYKKFKVGIKYYLKWGYFPEVKYYDVRQLIDCKNQIEIVWCARFIPLKHPETVIRIAERLSKNHVPYHISMIGDGELRKEIQNEAEKKGLDISFLGSILSTDVRQYMEKASIFLATSDYNEGWGAVINEGMNSGCASVVSSAMGAAPFLIKDGINGFLFKYNDVDLAYERVKQLLCDNNLSKTIGEKAYMTIVNEWNAHVAAERLCHIAQQINKKQIVFPQDGPCSLAETIYNTIR